VSWDSQICDYVYDPGKSTVWGGEYGPYVISSFSKGNATSTTIYFVMSTWNPYNTVLMKSTLKSPGGEKQTSLAGNPVLIQSQFGNMGNFEVVVPVTGGGLAHYWRNNDNSAFPWSAPAFLGQSVGQVDAVSLIESNYGNPGNFEIVARSADHLNSFWRDGSTFIWHGPYPVAIEGAGGSCGRQPVSGIAGNPVLIQSKFGQKGNFELLAPLAAGGIAHYFRDNDDSNLPWKAAPVFGQSAGVIDAITAIQSNFGSPGNLEVVARSGGQLIFFWRDDSPAPLTWHGPFPLIADGTTVSGVSGNPVLIQSRFGQKGNFELVVPLAGGGVAAYFRDNDDPKLPWHGPVAVEVLTDFQAVSFIQSHFGSPGNFEVVSRVGDQLSHSWRDSGPHLAWSGPFDFTGV
jgi:hypothetical protein